MLCYRKPLILCFFIEESILQIESYNGKFHSELYFSIHLFLENFFKKYAAQKLLFYSGHI